MFDISWDDVLNGHKCIGQIFGDLEVTFDLLSRISAITIGRGLIFRGMMYLMDTNVLAKFSVTLR